MTDTTSLNASGVQIDLISKTRSENMGTAEKIKMILDRVDDGAVLILEEGLSPDEESKLVERTMNRVDGETFTGIEMDSYTRPQTYDGILGRILGDTPSKMTVIGPANKVETLDKNENLLRTLVSDNN